MSGSSGIGGTSSTPEGVPGLGGVEASGGQIDISGLMHAKVGTLGELKAVLIQYMGEKEGTKFYNQFMTSFAMIMMQQIQESAQHAKEASQNMRMNT